MIIRKYGVTLQRLRREHIELVRQKRNAEEIRKYMFFRETITPEMQKKWFDSVDNVYNYYFIIEYGGDFVGLINGKNLDFEQKTSEGGIFIWEPKHLNSYLPIMCSVMMADVTFNVMGMNKTIAEILSSNSRSLHYNKKLGYTVVQEDASTGKIICELNKENYDKYGGAVRKAIGRIGKDPSPCTWDNIYVDQVDDVMRKKLYTNLPEQVQQGIDMKFEQLHR